MWGLRGSMFFARGLTVHRGVWSDGVLMFKLALIEAERRILFAVVCGLMQVGMLVLWLD